jgi:hypothetical protein
VTENMGEVGEAARTVGDSAESVAGASGDLHQRFAQLRQRIDGVLGELRNG